MPRALFLRDIGSAIGREEDPFPALGEPSPYSPRSRSTLFDTLTHSISGCVALSRPFEPGSLFSRPMLRPSSIAASRAFSLSGSTASSGEFGGERFLAVLGRPEGEDPG